MIHIALCRCNFSFFPAAALYPGILHAGIRAAHQYTCRRSGKCFGNLSGPVSMMGIHDRMRAIAGHIGHIHRIASQKIICRRHHAIQILLLSGQIVGAGQHHCIIRHKGIRTPDIAGITVGIAECALPERLAIALLRFALEVCIRCIRNRFCCIRCDCLVLTLSKQCQRKRSQCRCIAPVKASRCIHIFSSGKRHRN